MNKIEKYIKIDGIDYMVKPSNRKNKKYDVYKEGSYLLSFGDTRYKQYRDKLEYYEDQNHYDKKRRDAYRARASNIRNKQYELTYNNPEYANFWSYNYLW